MVLLSVTIFATGARFHAQEIPQGWGPHATPKIGSTALTCANYSEKEWRVTVSDGLPQITLVPSNAEQERPQEIPPGIQRLPGMKGRESKLKLQNGWLLGFDAGEFGGGLWFANDDGTTVELSTENVHGVFATTQGALVLAGLAHMGLDSGKVFIVPKVVRSSSDLKTLVELDGAPQAFTEISDGSELIVTTHGIWSVSSTGASAALLHRYRRDLGMLYPNSVAAAPDGTIYVGMRLFVVRYTPHAGGYVEQWMVPGSCKKFHVRGFDCVCDK